MRKKLFFLCLTQNNDSLRKFAQRLNVSAATVSSVLSGKAKSKRIRSLIDLYIAANLQRIKNQLSQFENAA